MKMGTFVIKMFVKNSIFSCEPVVLLFTLLMLLQTLECKTFLFFSIGTIFLERWKRANARLSYQWDVDTFEEQVK